MKVWDQKPAKHELGSRESVDEHGDPAMLEANRVANRQDVGLLWENGDDGLNGITCRVNLQPGVQEVKGVSCFLQAKIKVSRRDPANQGL